ncbi:MAG: cyclic nucleotide-binding domain-containing protein [Fibrobacter sp.]|nr:cyclic nucleotide-binding domain-containing protein [Fibrobacter sp.]
MLVKEGEYLFLEGDKASSLVIVKSGMLVGTSKQFRKSKFQNFGPGSLIGEFSILESRPREYTVRAAENSEVLFIEQKDLMRELEHKPGWFRSTLSFLASHCHTAEENSRKMRIVQALPALLFLFKNHLDVSGSDNITLALLQQKMLVLDNVDYADTEKLLQILEGLEMLRIEGDLVRVSNLQIVPMLYDALQFRALNKQVSPDILPITDQLVLTTFVKAVRENGISIRGTRTTVSADLFIAQAKKTMFGSLTMRTLAPLLQNGMLEAEPAYSEATTLEAIESISGDFEHILDLLELNRIFPLLDKKLV